MQNVGILYFMLSIMAYGQWFTLALNTGSTLHIQLLQQVCDTNIFDSDENKTDGACWESSWSEEAG